MVMIAKGNRSQQVTDACQKHGGFYLGSIGGPAAILACQAGKDVYVEKQHSHNIWESRKMIEAARKYKCVMQVGTQNRSAPYNFEARDYIKSGAPGDIRLVKVYNLKNNRPFNCAKFIK